VSVSYSELQNLDVQNVKPTRSFRWLKVLVEKPQEV